MVDWTQPTLTTNYTQVLTDYDNRLDDVATWFKGSTSTNLPTNTIRLNTSDALEYWTGASWASFRFGLLSIWKSGGGAADYLHLRDNASTQDLVFHCTGSSWQLNSEFGGTGGVNYLNFSSNQLTSESKGLVLGAFCTTETSFIELGGDRTGDGIALIDFHADGTVYTDYALRLIRNAGANGNSQLIHRGTASLQITTQDAASITFNTTNTGRWLLEAGGHFRPQANNTYDIGTDTFGVRKVYMAPQVTAGGSSTTSGYWFKLFDVALTDINANVRVVFDIVGSGFSSYAKVAAHMRGNAATPSYGYVGINILHASENIRTTYSKGTFKIINDGAGNYSVWMQVGDSWGWFKVYEKQLQISTPSATTFTWAGSSTLQATEPTGTNEYGLNGSIIQYHVPDATTYDYPTTAVKHGGFSVHGWSDGNTGLAYTQNEWALQLYSTGENGTPDITYTGIVMKDLRNAVARAYLEREARDDTEDGYLSLACRTRAGATVLNYAQNISGDGTNLFHTFSGGSVVVFRQNLSVGNIFAEHAAWNNSTVSAIQLGDRGSIYAEREATVDSYTVVGENMYFDGTNLRYIGSKTASRYVQAYGRHLFYTYPAGTAGGILTGGTTPLQVREDNSVRAHTYYSFQAATDSKSLIRLYSNSADYAIGFKSGITYGGLANYAITTNMNNVDSRGFWWGDSAHSTTQGAMALTTNGKLTVAHSARLGYGESDTTTPGSTYKFDVSGSIHLTEDIVIAERADHAQIPTAAKGQLWVKNDTPNVLIFTDDAGTDHDLTRGLRAHPSSPFATTSGTSVTISNIPSNINRITLTFNDVSNNGGGYWIRIGDSGGIETSGYRYSELHINTLNGIINNGTTTDQTIWYLALSAPIISSAEMSGTFTITKVSSTVYIISGTMGNTNNSDPQTFIFNGSKTLTGGPISQILITSTDTFDNGSIAVHYE